MASDDAVVSDESAKLAFASRPEIDLVEDAFDVSRVALEDDGIAINVGRDAVVGVGR